METAALLDIPDAKWYCEFYLRELDKGILAGKSKKDRQEQHNHELERKAIDPFFYAAPGGESVADCCIRVEKVLDILRRTCAGLRVAIVCHGNIMKAFRVRMERMSQAQYYANFIKNDGETTDKIRNCQIMCYSRRNPHNHRVSSKYRWFKSVCPWDEESLANTHWTEIDRPNYNNQELMEAVQSIPQLVNYAEGEITMSDVQSPTSDDDDIMSQKSPGNKPLDVRNPKRMRLSVDCIANEDQYEAAPLKVSRQGANDTDSGEDGTASE